MLSSLVSVATLGVLLLQRTLPEQFRIWTFRYGAKEGQTSTKVRISSPPWILWLFVLLITFAFLTAYYRDGSEAISSASSLKTTVWIDRSLSSQSQLNANSELRSQIAGQVFKSTNHPLVIKAATVWDAANKNWRNKVNLLEIANQTDFERLLVDKPSPLAFDLTAPALKEAYAAENDSADQHGRLIVISDGQLSTTNKLSALSELYSEVVFIAVPGVIPDPVRGQEVLPSGLAKAWGTSATSGETHAGGPSGARQLDFVTLAEGSAIPIEARPGLYTAPAFAPEYSTSDGQDTNSAQEPKTEFFSSASGFIILDPTERRGFGTIFTHCNSYPGGPSELSPLADLQSLVRFFDIKLRTMGCEEAADSHSAFSDSEKPIAQSSQDSNSNSKDRKVWETSSGEFDPWTYRRSSLWLVPISEQVYNTFLYQRHLWLPEGFRSESDALFYYADPGNNNSGNSAADADSGDDERSEKSAMRAVRQQSVQFEKSAIPIGLMLAPPPAFPPIGKVNESFRAVVTAFDKTELIYRLGNLPIYYLRTPLSMPNGELGRTGFWPSFWLQAIRSAPGQGRALRIHHLQTPESIDLPAANLLIAIEPETLTAEANYQGHSQVDAEIRPGMFLETETGVLHLVEYPASERDGQFMGTVEIAETIRSSGGTTPTAATAGTQRSKTTQTHTIVAALAGLLALTAYWLRLRAAHSRQPKTTVGLILVCFVLPFSKTEAAAAKPLDQAASLPFMTSQEQRLPDPISVPFRVAWCSTQNKSEVTAGYKAFRDALANRGTIHLSETIQFGACVPGGAEIWWTDSVDDLDPAFLKTHIQAGGIFVIEGASTSDGRVKAPIRVPRELIILEEPSVGLRWEQPEKRGLLYRSFYLLQTFDGCTHDGTLMLTLRKKQTAKSPIGVVTSASFLRKQNDCFKGDNDYRTRSFVNLMYAFLTTDYKEDQLQLPELLRRVRNLGLEP
jgi:hypothetical protein